MQELIDRFQRCRWSDTRKKMEKMKPGDVLHLPMSEKNNAHGSANRLSDAYENRMWKDSRKGGKLVVRCLRKESSHFSNMDSNKEQLSYHNPNEENPS